MAWDSAVVTIAGVQLLNRVLAGGSLTLDHATLGAGVVAESALMAQTTIAGEKQRAAIIACKNIGGTGQRVHILVENRDISAGYQMRQVGIWAHVNDDDAPTLLAILQDSVGQSIPSSAEIAEFSLDFYAIIKFSWTGTFSVDLDPSTLITQAALNDAIGEHNYREDAHADIRDAVKRAQETADAAAENATKVIISPVPPASGPALWFCSDRSWRPDPMRVATAELGDPALADEYPVTGEVNDVIYPVINASVSEEDGTVVATIEQ